jgi:hypothetical protein
MADFDEALGQLTIANARLKQIDVSKLSDQRKQDRARAMRGLRTLQEKLVLVQYEALGDEAKASADQLKLAAATLKNDLATATTATATIDTVTSALGVLTKLSALFT